MRRALLIPAANQTSPSPPTTNCRLVVRVGIQNQDFRFLATEFSALLIPILNLPPGLSHQSPGNEVWMELSELGTGQHLCDEPWMWSLQQVDLCQLCGSSLPPALGPTGTLGCRTGPPGLPGLHTPHCPAFCHSTKGLMPILPVGTFGAWHR